MAGTTLTALPTISQIFATSLTMPDYIRINTTLANSPKVVQLARKLSCTKDEALGVMVRWLSWLDTYTTDGCTGLSPAEIDEYIFNELDTDYLEGLRFIGWADLDENNNVFAVDFCKYNGPTAKKRIAGAERQRKHRNKKKDES